MLYPTNQPFLCYHPPLLTLFNPFPRPSFPISISILLHPRPWMPPPTLPPRASKCLVTPHCISFLPPTRNPWHTMVSDPKKLLWLTWRNTVPPRHNIQVVLVWVEIHQDQHTETGNKRHNTQNTSSLYSLWYTTRKIHKNIIVMMMIIILLAFLASLWHTTHPFNTIYLSSSTTLL